MWLCDHETRGPWSADVLRVVAIGRNLPSVLTGVLLVLVMAAPSGAVAAAAPCTAPQRIRGLGVACEVEGGYLVLGPVGWFFTHGGDPVLSYGWDALVDAKADAPVCAPTGTDGFHAQVIYARASDRKDRYISRRALIANLVGRANGAVVAEAARFGRRVELVTSCRDGEVWVRNIELPTSFAETDSGTVFQDLADLGLWHPTGKLVVWFDGKPPDVFAEGSATSFIDNADPTPSNRANRGDSVAITWGGRGRKGATTLLHEWGHMMGAVNLSAPNTSGGGHCIDGPDVMCYYGDDGGSRGGLYSSVECRITHFDCGNNDYFHPAPRSRSWLANHWNIASPVNRFVAGCLYKAGDLTMPSAGIDVGGTIEPARGVLGIEEPDVIGVEHRVPASCRGRRFAASALQKSGLESLIPQPIREPLASVINVDEAQRRLGLDGQGEADVDVCWYAGAARVRCDTAGTYASGIVPREATMVRVQLSTAMNATYTLNVI